jgi:hypothetical protein
MAERQFQQEAFAARKPGSTDPTARYKRRFVGVKMVNDKFVDFSRELVRRGFW